MNLNFFSLIIFFYILIILQTSFFVHFAIFNNLPNFVLVLVILINLLEKRESSSGLWSAVIAGFLLDIFSTSPFNFVGFYILTLLAISIFIKIILKKYVLIPNIKKI